MSHPPRRRRRPAPSPRRCAHCRRRTQPSPRQKTGPRVAVAVGRGRRPTMRGPIRRASSSASRDKKRPPERPSAVATAGPRGRKRRGRKRRRRRRAKRSESSDGGGGEDEVPRQGGLLRNPVSRMANSAERQVHRAGRDRGGALPAISPSRSRPGSGQDGRGGARPGSGGAFRPDSGGASLCMFASAIAIASRSGRWNNSFKICARGHSAADLR
mmetsp:Transcript_26380/g.56087  ORF Transcript_26380/g.56087 Transcript_26380/m.56087 type:complete len:214 (+) Transcript_26380:72-713(+)